ncbi:MAG TPA: hypothetical protein VFW71_16405 [Actinomycetota bacterium]|nr:hypothetical protein [Actinomycetota bacterium]
MSLGKLLGVVPDANPSSPAAHHGDEGPPGPDLSFMGHGDEIQLTDFKLARSIAVVTWGALAWDPRELPLVCDDEERPEEAWHPGGPELPIEFSRVAVDCRLIPVLDPANGVPVPTLWARSRRNDLNAAVEDLMKAEGARNRKLIGFVDTKDNTHRCLAHMAMAEPVKAWARGHGVDCVIWAELPPNFANHTGRPFSLDTAMRYLGELPRALVEQAREYVNRTPACVDTPLRRRLAEVGWPGLG